MIFLTVIAVMLTGYFLCVFPTQWLKIERVHQPLGLNRKILQISDLHVERLRIAPERFRSLIRREDPDLIVITGDFTKRESALPRVEKYLQVFRDCERPVYAVLGNHDYQLANTRGLLDRAEQYRINVLRNESVRFADFELVGIDDYYTRHSNAEKAFSRTDATLPKIVITHDPNIVLEIDHQFDYLMAGHFHGKQFNLPYLFKLKPMGELPRRGIYKGLHRSHFGTYYISKGVGQSGVNMRLFVRSEVTVHYL